MRHLSIAIGFGLLAACSGRDAAPTPGAGAPVGPRAAISVTPRAEETWMSGSVGTGDQACRVFVHGWDSGAPGCRLSISHCTRQGQCMSLADERTVSCSAAIDVCGEQVSCACPLGTAEPVVDRPGTITLHPDGSVESFSHADAPARCSARPTPMGLSRSDAPLCVVAIHECDPSEECTDRNEMFSCGVRGEVCGRPVVCRCNEPAAQPSPPAPTPPSEPNGPTPTKRPPRGARVVHPLTPDMDGCLEMYSACGPEPSARRCTSAPFHLDCGASGRVPNGDLLFCECPSAR